MYFSFVFFQIRTHCGLIMLIAFTLGAPFLVSYVIYHGAADSTEYGDLDNDGMVSALN